MFSFRKRRKYVDAAPFMRRIIDRTTATSALLNDGRQQNRYSRSLPLILAPWVDGEPDLSRMAFGVTKDISDTGMSLITTREFHGDVVFSFMLDSQITDRNIFFRAEPKRQLKLVEGIVEYGFLVTEMLNEHHGRTLETFGQVVVEANNQRLEPQSVTAS